MTHSPNKNAWQAFRPYAPPVIYCLSVAAGLALLSLFAYLMGQQAQARADAFANDPSCRAAASSSVVAGACTTEQATAEALRLGAARGPTPGFVARRIDGSTVSVDLPHGDNDAILGLMPGGKVQIRMWQGRVAVVWIRGQAYATSANPLQESDAWQQGARMGALVLWVPLLIAAWVALRGWILSREPTYD